MQYRESKALILCGAATFLLSGAVALAGDPPTTCGVVSKAEIETAFRTAVHSERLLFHGEPLSICTFALDEDGSVTVLLRGDSGRDWKLEQAGRMKQSARFRPVVELGDDAYEFDVGSAGRVLCIFYGDQYLQIASIRAGESTRISPAGRVLARIILSRLARRSGLASNSPARSDAR